MAGVSDVKEAVKIAKNEATSFKRRTILFMDEIHRFNKLQQVKTNFKLKVVYFKNTIYVTVPRLTKKAPTGTWKCWIIEKLFDFQIHALPAIMHCLLYVRKK